MRNGSTVPVHVLLVERDASPTGEVRQALAADGYHVETVTTSADALAFLERESCDIVVMDVELADGDTGIECARRIDTHHDLPIVFRTARDDQATLAAIRTVTRHGYVLKRSGYTVLREVMRLAMELHREQRALRRSRDLYLSIANLTGDIIVRHDVEGRWVFLNDRARTAWGIPDGDISQLNYLDYVEPEDLDATRAAAETMRQNQTPITGLVNRVHTVDGLRVYEWNSSPVFDEHGRYAGFQSTGRDITRQKEAEQQIRDLLNEREVLLMEAYHRVKNDLGFVGALLSLQAQETSDAEARAALTEASDRIRLITRIYETLSRSNQQEPVDLRAIVDQIVRDTVAGALPPQMTLHTDVEPISVSAKFAIKVGIILNELITNSAKYGADGADEEPLNVSIRHLSDEEALRIEVSDTGPGFPPPVLAGEAFGFGLSIVQSLVRQHDGTMTLSNAADAGAVATIHIQPA